MNYINSLNNFKMKDYLNEFIEKIRNSEIDLYNEFGLQFELALTGEIICPTGEKKRQSIEIINSYQIKWAELINGFSYYLIEIKKPQFK